MENKRKYIELAQVLLTFYIGGFGLRYGAFYCLEQYAKTSGVTGIWWGFNTGVMAFCSFFALSVAVILGKRLMENWK